MSWNKHHINNLLLNPELLSEKDLEHLQKLCGEFPYSGLLALSFLEGLHKTEDIRLAKELTNRAFLVNDRKRLFQLLNKSQTEIELVLEDSDEVHVPRDSTDSPELETLNKLIEQSAANALFLQEYSGSNAEIAVPTQPSEKGLQEEKNKNSEIEELSFTGWLSKGNTQKPLDVSNPEPIKAQTDFFSPIKKAKESVNSENIPVSETLAKVFIIQGNYPKAIAIYEQLILAIPEKKAYFAGQIKKITKKVSE